MKLIVSFMLAAVVLGAASTPAVNAADPVVTSVRVEPFVSHIGDQVTLTIEVDHDEGVTIKGPDDATDFGQLELIESSEPHVTPRVDGSERTTLQYTVTSFVLGSAVTPPFEISWRGPGVEGVVTTESAPYSVDNVRSPDDNALRPLPAQFALPQPAPPAAVPLTFAVMIAGLTALGYWLMRRAINTRPAPVLSPESPTSAAIPPDVLARAALDELAGVGLAERDVEAYYARIAETVRTYLSVRFEFPAYAMTRTEMERGMTGAGIDRWPARVTSNLLEQCDAVQFAKFRPAPERRAQDLAAAYEIVELTTAEG
jgi:hypothetical protein